MLSRGTYKHARWAVHRILLAGYKGASRLVVLRRLVDEGSEHPLAGEVCRLCVESEEGSPPLLTWGEMALHLAQQHPSIRRVAEEELAHAENCLAHQSTSESQSLR